MIKKIFDFSFAFFLLIVFLVPLCIICIPVAIFIGFPLFFKQRRPGLHGNIFNIYKFRTMSNHRDLQGNLLPDGMRITKFGQFLRKYSLDEIPELFNILRGEMSFVGPRPLLIEYMEYYSADQRRRHDVLPGITGWAQINGRNNISWTRKFELDTWYVDNQNFLLDLKILFRTVFIVFAASGINKDGHITTDYFDGHN